MNSRNLTLTCVCTFLCGCSVENILSEKEYNQGINVLPLPQNINVGSGRFIISKSTQITISDDSLGQVADSYARKMQASTGMNVKVTDKKVENAINLSIDRNVGKGLDTELAAESYLLSVKENGVDIKASSLRGLFYGMATLMQLLPAEIESGHEISHAVWSVPVVDISDSPRFKYRGLMLDVARHFISVEGLKKHIDMLASVKINNLHLHLTDYQEWRIEIRKYPRLTAVGGTRIDEYGKEYSGFYTQEEIKDLVKYARERFVNIIPEIDVPGHSAEDKLQSYAISRCEQILKKYGKKLIGWDEILQGGLAPEATVMSWRGEAGGIASALMNHNVIMTPTSGGMYFDHYQGNSQAEPFAWGGYAPIVRSYNYNPVPDTLVKMGKEKYILGVQGNAWTECMYTEDIVEYRVYPRIFAVAETGWTPDGKKDFNDFSRRLNNMAVRMDYHGINYHIPLPEQPDFCRNHVAFTDVASVSFGTSRPMKMVYTTDGTEPDLHSPVYDKPIQTDTTCTIRIRSV